MPCGLNGGEDPLDLSFVVAAVGLRVDALPVDPDLVPVNGAPLAVPGLTTPQGIRVNTQQLCGLINVDPFQVITPEYYLGFKEYAAQTHIG